MVSMESILSRLPLELSIGIKIYFKLTSFNFKFFSRYILEIYSITFGIGMAFSNNPPSDFEQNISDTLKAEDKVLCTIDLIDVLSSHPSEHADVPYCSFFLRCLSRCLKSRPKNNAPHLPKDSAERKSFTEKWLEEHSNSSGFTEPDTLSQETAAQKFTHQTYRQPVDKKLLEESHTCKDICNLDVEAVHGLPENAIGTNLVASVISEKVSSEDSQLYAVPLHQSLNNKIAESSGLCGNCMTFDKERSNILSASSERQRHDQTTFLKCNANCSSKGTSTGVKLKEVSSKFSLEKWRDGIEQAPRKYFEIDAGLVAGRADLQHCKGRTFHLSIDLDKKLYNRPRENVIYQNGLICVQTGPPRILETQGKDQNLSSASEDSDTISSDKKC